MSAAGLDLGATVTGGTPGLDLTPKLCEWCGAEAAVGPCPMSLKCRTCLAEPGIKCRRPSGHDCNMHVTRIDDAEQDLPDEMRRPEAVRG